MNVQYSNVGDDARAVAKLVVLEDTTANNQNDSVGIFAKAAALWRGRRGVRVVSSDCVRSSLLKHQVRRGGLVRVLDRDGKAHFLKVVATRPSGIVVVDDVTEIEINSGNSIGNISLQPNYSNIGGLSREIERVREIVELPLRYPELFIHLGVEPPKGILLYGPPGSGKTLIARAIAHAAGCRFVFVNGPEIIQQHYGESEALLRRMFEEAQNQPPTIIFLDEVDAIAPRRDMVLGEVEKRVVGQLLALMDGLKSRGRVIVIAATNLPNNIDPALRRPGRFDREVSISPPDEAGRREILDIHCGTMPLAENVDLERVAAITHGFLGADLAALCREAAMLCARDVLLTLKDKELVVSAETLDAMTIEMHHFDQARREIDLSTTRQVFSELPDTRWDDVVGLDEVKQTLRETVEWPLKYGDLFESAKVMPPKGILLAGPPGTGKTLIVKALAAESGVNFIAVKGPELLSKWVGDTERGLREVFKKARQAAPAILFFDEIDTLLPMRGGNSADSGVMNRIVGQFMSEMDSVEELRGVAVLGATNRPELIDPALMRPGRFEYIITLPLPDLETRESMLRVLSRGRCLADDVSLKSVAQRTEGATGADLDALCRRAAMYAIRAVVERQCEKASGPIHLSRLDFEYALADIWSKVRPA